MNPNFLEQFVVFNGPWDGIGRVHFLLNSKTAAIFIRRLSCLNVEKLVYNLKHDQASRKVLSLRSGTQADFFNVITVWKATVIQLMGLFVPHM